MAIIPKYRLRTCLSVLVIWIIFPSLLSAGRLLEAVGTDGLLHDLNVVHSLAQEFTLNSSVSVDSVDFRVVGTGSYDLWLTNYLWVYDGTGNTLPGATPANVLFHETLTFPSAISTESISLGGIGLQAGSYFLVLSSQNGGQVVANGSPVPSTFGYTTVSSLESYANSSVFAPGNRYQPGQYNALNYALNGSIQTAPEPATGVLMLLVFAALVAVVRYRYHGVLVSCSRRFRTTSNHDAV